MILDFILKLELLIPWGNGQKFSKISAGLIIQSLVAV